MMMLILVLLTILVLTSSYGVRVSKQVNRISSRLLMNDFARQEPPPSKIEEDGKETKQIVKKEIEEEAELSNAMRDKLLKEIRDQGGDPNYSKGAIAGNPILIISFVVAVLAVASYLIGAI